MEFLNLLNPFFVFGLIRSAVANYRMWKIRRYAPSARRIPLIVVVSQKDFEAIPSALKEGVLFLVSDQQPESQRNGDADPKGQA